VTRILEDHDVAAFDEDVDVARSPAQILVVGQPREQHREAPGPTRPVHIGAQRDAVARRHGNVLVDQHGEFLLASARPA
jgi:hypothetical protein